MKALVWEAPRVMALREQKRPSVTADEVLIQVAYAGICGSELSGYLGHNALRVPPLVMGHEFSGTLAEIGNDARAEFPHLSIGQAVTVNPLWYDGTCEFCLRGDTQLCASRKLIGAHRPGAYAEFVNVPAKMVVPLPAGMSLRTGALTEPVACGVRIGELAGAVNDDDALVVGAGPIGLLALQALKAKGAARVFISDLDAERLAMGAALGGIALNPRETDVTQTVREKTNGRGVAVAVDCVGSAVTRKTCVQSTRSGGTLILSGLHQETSEMPAAEIIRREIVVRGSFSYNRENFAEALRRLQNEEVHLDPWIVEAPLEEGGKWFDRLIDAPGNVAKVLLVP
jgi:threonine dehydrogenase-like Zn-dependent dehydrogenase